VPAAAASKGQLISECLFDVFKFSKKPTKNLTNFCPGSKKWSNQQSKGTFL
jgi:predicted nucleic acid binding AN1-type Zn finger protein